jgi:hypothetical protein
MQSFAWGYAAVLAGLPEELRRAYRDGDFSAGLKDQPNQVIPTAWIEAAQARWKPQAPRQPMTAMAVDVAQGGDDWTVLARREYRHLRYPRPQGRQSGPATGLAAGGSKL